MCRYAQVISELGPVIDFAPPPLFQDIVMALRDYLSIVNFASAKWCDNLHCALSCYSYVAAHAVLFTPAWASTPSTTSGGSRS